jgi:hypothetical protein
MNDDAPDADRVGRLRNKQRAVTKKRAAKAPALLRAVNGQSAKDDNRWTRSISTAGLMVRLAPTPSNAHRNLRSANGWSRSD